MSKPFTRESDDAPERPVRLPRPALLPTGAKNYLTPDGARRLRGELDRLVEAGEAAVAATEADASRRPRGADERIAHLQQSLQAAVIVPPPPPPHDRVKFGATVVVRERGGSETSYRIVGVDETDIDRGWISWISPLAKALLNARPGERIQFQSPSGKEEMEIVSVVYA